MTEGNRREPPRDGLESGPAIGADAAGHPEALRARAVAGVAWSSASRVGSQVLRFAVIAVLARLLVPRDFGLVAMVAVFTGFASLLVDAGLGAALVQRRQLEERHLSSAFWLNLGIAGAVAACVAGLAPAVAALYGEPRLTALAAVSALSLVITSTTVVQGALVQRRLAFRRLAAVDLASAAFGGAAGIGAALLGAGVWSLVAHSMVGAAAYSALLWLGSGWRPRLLVDRDAIRELWRYSGHLLAFSSLHYWARNADNFVVGRFVGASALGLYSRAYNTMLLPLHQVSWVAARVMFPILSEIQDDPTRVRRAYLRAVGLIALVTFPLLVGLIVAAEPFIVTVYGERWRSAAPILQVLAAAGLIQSIGTSVAWIYQSQGRTDWMFRWGAVVSIVNIAGFFVGVRWDALGVAAAYAIVTVVSAYPGFAIPGRLIGLRVVDVVAVVRGSAFAAMLMGGTVWLVEHALADGWSPPVRLAALTLVGALVYTLAIHVFHPPAYGELRTLARERRAKARQPERALPR